MFTSIYSYFFPRPSVASVTAGFEAQVKALDKIAAAKAAEAEALEDKIEQMRDAIDAADAEHDAASAISARLASFTSL